MSASQFRFFVILALVVFLGLGLTWYITRGLKVGDEVTKCMGGNEEIRAFCEANARKPLS